VKIHVEAVEALRQKEREDETQLSPKLMVFWVSGGGAQAKGKRGWNSIITKIDGFLSFTPCWMLMYFFAGFLKKSHLVYDQTPGSRAGFSLLYRHLYYK
jgi:hypothetical protein